MRSRRTEYAAPSILWTANPSADRGSRNGPYPLAKCWVHELRRFNARGGPDLPLISGLEVQRGGGRLGSGGGNESRRRDNTAIQLDARNATELKTYPIALHLWQHAQSKRRYCYSRRLAPNRRFDTRR